MTAPRPLLARLVHALRCARGPRVGRRRAFALPMVVLLALVATLGIGVMLERASQAMLATQREIQVYRRHHDTLGMKEMVNRWLGSNQSRLAERLGDDGLAFRLELPGGEEVHVYFAPGQGQALTSLDLLGGDRNLQARQLARIIAAMEQEARQSGGDVILAAEDPALIDIEGDTTRFHFSPGLSRPFGPVEVDVNTAPFDVLTTIARVGIIEGSPDAFVAELVSAREDHDLTEVDVRAASSSAQLTDGDQATVRTMLTTNATLWRVVAERLDRRGRLIERTGGYFQTGLSEGGSDFNQGGGFLSWRTLDLPEAGLVPGVGGSYR